jgi:hypothetical protein
MHFKKKSAKRPQQQQQQPQQQQQQPQQQQKQQHQQRQHYLHQSLLQRPRQGFGTFLIMKIQICLDAICFEKSMNLTLPHTTAQKCMLLYASTENSDISIFIAP